MILNPFASRLVDDLRPLFEAGAELGERLDVGHACLRYHRELCPRRALAKLPRSRSGSAAFHSSRYLAADCSCRVAAIDLTPNFVEAARILTARCGLAERIEFRQGTLPNGKW